MNTSTISVFSLLEHLLSVVEEEVIQDGGKQAPILTSLKNYADIKFRTYIKVYQ